MSDELRPRPYPDKEPANTSASTGAFYLKIKTSGGLEGVYGPIDNSYYHFEKNAPRPVNGRLTLNEQPGFVIEIDAGIVEKRTLVRC